MKFKTAIAFGLVSMVFGYTAASAANLLPFTSTSFSPMLVRAVMAGLGGGLGALVALQLIKGDSR